MIDTIGIRYFIRISQSILDLWDYHRVNSRDRFFCYYQWQEVLLNGARITFQYYPYNPKKPLLRIEFSLPHVLFGTNIDLDYNLDHAIETVNAIIQRFPFLVGQNLWSAQLFRLDITYDHQVENLIPYFIKALQSLEYPYHRQGPKSYGSNGVMFQCKDYCVKFYDKELESKDKSAYGILRHEVTMRRRQIYKRTGSEDPKLEHISPEFCFDVLEDSLRKLGILNRSIGTVDTTLAKLVEEYGEIEGMYLFGWLMAKMKHPSKEALAVASSAHPKTIKRRLTKIIQAGLPLTITTSEEPLPPLTIDKSRWKQSIDEIPCVQNVDMIHTKLDAQDQTSA